MSRSGGRSARGIQFDATNKCEVAMSRPGPDDIRAKVSARAFGNRLIQNDFRGIVAETIVETGADVAMLPW
jgi:hypothetical protein